MGKQVRIVLCCGSAVLLIGCGSVTYQQCDPRILNTWGYFRCGEENVQKYVAEERNTLAILKQEGNELSEQHAANNLKKQQLRQRLESLRGETREIVRKIQYLQQIASQADQLSEIEQEQLSQDIDKALEEYESNSDSVATALYAAKGVYDVADTIHEIKTVKKNIQTVRRMRNVSLLRKILRFTRLTLPGFLLGLAGDYIIGQVIDYHLKES